MKHAKIILLTALFALGAPQTYAQFSMGGVGGDTRVTKDIPVSANELDLRFINAAEARMLRRMAWNARNNVDFKVSVTGMATQFNKSWTTNNQNSVSGELAAYYYHIFTRDKYSTTFKFDGIYGMNFVDDAWFKNQDKLELYYLMAWKLHEGGALKNWSYGFSAKFASQFTEGFKSRTERELWSNFMAPGALNLGVGFTWKSPKTKWPFVVTVNPIAGDGLFVLDDRINDQRRQKLGIVLPAPGKAGEFLYTDYRSKIEGGSSLTVDFNRTFVMGNGSRSLQYITTLSSFYGWMTELSRKHETSPAVIVPTVGWTNRLIFTPLRFLAMEFRTTTLYDRSQVDRVQMQYYLRVGLTYRFKNR